MHPKRLEAVNLRQAGASYNEISRILGLSKGTLHYWFKNKSWSKKIKAKLTREARLKMVGKMRELSSRAKEKRVKLYGQKRRKAEIMFKRHKNETLFNSGLMIYWGEGDSNLLNGQIRVTNSQPLMLRLFKKFLWRYLPEVKERVKVYLVLYEDLEEGKCKGYWSKMLNISLDRFYKSQYIKGRLKNKRLPYGIGTLIVSSRADKEVIIAWLELIKKEISLTRV